MVITSIIYFNQIQQRKHDKDFAINIPIISLAVKFHSVIFWHSYISLQLMYTDFIQKKRIGIIGCIKMSQNVPLQYFTVIISGLGEWCLNLIHSFSIYLFVCLIILRFCIQFLNNNICDLSLISWHFGWGFFVFCVIYPHYACTVGFYSFTIYDV